MNSTITTTAHAHPKRVLSNQDIEKLVDTSDEWIQSRTGIKQRYIVSKDEATSDICTDIANELLRKSNLNAKEIDLIIIGTVTPDYLVPSTAALVQKNIKASNAWGFDLNAACSGFLYALETASCFINLEKYNKIMVIGVDTMTSVLNFKDRDTCVLFGDGGGGAIITSTKKGGIKDSILRMDGNGAQDLIIPAGGSRLPASIESVNSRLHYIRQDGKKIFKAAVKGMADVSEELLLRNNLTGKDIKLFIPHQANKRIIFAAAKRCGISTDKVLINIDKYGNTTAGTIPIAINEAVESQKIKNGDLILLAAFGAGFTWGSMLIEWNDLS